MPYASAVINVTNISLGELLNNSNFSLPIYFTHPHQKKEWLGTVSSQYEQIVISKVTNWLHPGKPFLLRYHRPFMLARSSEDVGSLL